MMITPVIVCCLKELTQYILYTKWQATNGREAYRVQSVAISA
jgi:hypothetical protein